MILVNVLIVRACRPTIAMRRVMFPGPLDVTFRAWEERFYTPPPPGNHFRDCKRARIKTEASVHHSLWVVVVVVVVYKIALPSATPARLAVALVKSKPWGARAVICTSSALLVGMKLTLSCVRLPGPRRSPVIRTETSVSSGITAQPWRSPEKRTVWSGM